MELHVQLIGINKWYKCIYIYIPRTQLMAIFEGQPSKTRPKLQSKQGSFGF